jgi:hypothetical protein
MHCDAYTFCHSFSFTAPVCSASLHGAASQLSATRTRHCEPRGWKPFNIQPKVFHYSISLCEQFFHASDIDLCSGRFTLFSTAEALGYSFLIPSIFFLYKTARKRIGTKQLNLYRFFSKQWKLYTPSHFSI